jgi:hypothetical protein
MSLCIIEIVWRHLRGWLLSRSWTRSWRCYRRCPSGSSLLPRLGRS